MCSEGVLHGVFWFCSVCVPNAFSLWSVCIWTLFCVSFAGVGVCLLRICSECFSMCSVVFRVVCSVEVLLVFGMCFACVYCMIYMCSLCWWVQYVHSILIVFSVNCACVQCVVYLFSVCSKCDWPVFSICFACVQYMFCMCSVYVLHVFREV